MSPEQAGGWIDVSMPLKSETATENHEERETC
jgi:hypothetical protein